MDCVQIHWECSKFWEAPTFPFTHTSLTLCVLQAEAGLVALSHLGAVEAQQVIVSEYFHAVVVPGSQKQGPMSVSGTMAAWKQLPSW